RPRWTDAFYPLVLLHWGHAENLLWAWQIGFTSAGLIVLIWLACMIRARWNDQQDGWALAIVAVLLPLCGAVGMCFLPFLIVWLLYRALIGKTPKAIERYWSLAGATAGLLLGAMYFSGYTMEHSPPASTITEILEAMVQFVSLGLGRGDLIGWRIVGTSM